MKKIRFFLILILTALLVSACAKPLKVLGTSNVIDYIEPPTRQHVSVTGTWVQTDSLFLGEGDPPQTEVLTDTNRYIVLGLDFVGAFNQYTEKPDYKSKMVNASNYSILKLRKTPEDVGITDNNIEILSVEGEERFYLEMIVLDPTHIMVAKDGYLYRYELESKEVSKETTAKFRTPNASAHTPIPKPGSKGNSTLLLGIKSLGNSNTVVPDYAYKTVMLHFPENSDEIKIMATPNLFVPRKTGFWKVGVVRSETGGVLSDRIEASPFLLGSGEATETGISMEDSIGRNITFINDMYMSVESTYYQDRFYTQYNTYTFDTLADKMPIDISLIAGEKGKTEILSKGAAEAELLRNNNTSLIVRAPESNEWGIVRRNGRWIFRSIVRAIDGDSMTRRGFDLHILPITRVFTHNELAISWNTIKERHPSAIDALTSPSQDFVIIQDAFRLYIYRITNGTMGDEPLGIIRNPMNNRIVMGEWAQGSTADDWMKTFGTTEQLEVTQ